MTKKYSSFKNHQVATDRWREYIGDAPQQTLHENTISELDAGALKGPLKSVVKAAERFKEPIRYAASETLQSDAIQVAADMFLRVAQGKIEAHLIENADSRASMVVPDIPFDGDIIEGVMQRKCAEIIADQADEVAALIIDAIKDQYLSTLSSDPDLKENIQEAMGQAGDPVEAAEAAIEAMDDAAQDKILNVLLDKIGADDLQEAKGNPVLKTLLNLPGGRDLAAMYMAINDRETPKKLRILAAFAILNLISPVDVGTFMGLDFLGPLGAIDDIILLRRMFKKFEKAGLPGEKHHDKLQLAAGEELTPDRAAEVELSKTRDMAGARQTAAGSREKLRKL